MITHVGIVRDHSASMKNLTSAAKDDYNATLEEMKKQDNTFNNVYISVVECGVGYNAEVKTAYQNVKARMLSTMSNYVADGGGTPLYDSVMKTIEILLYNERNRFSIINEGVAFLVIITTDGFENRSRTTAAQLAEMIRKLNSTDLWTFVFRVPKGHKQNIIQIGVSENNVLEWEQTTEALKQASNATISSAAKYFDGRSRGVTSTQSFYTTDLTNITISKIKKELTDITSKIMIESVWSIDEGTAIKYFCDIHFGEYQVGYAYFELTKSEKVQRYKNIVIKHKKSGKYYGGHEARTILGLPDYEVKVNPGDHHQYEVYIQSTSLNRKLVPKTKVLYWKAK
jgi:hypothetical protein